MVWFWSYMKVTDQFLCPSYKHKILKVWELEKNKEQRWWQKTNWIIKKDGGLMLFQLALIYYWEFLVPASAPQLVYQRPSYVLSSLWI